MFWIHGGAFSLGQVIEYQPNRYMEHDIVLVEIQYRLGPLGALFLGFLKLSAHFSKLLIYVFFKGFLSFDTDDVPGNAGIFDQIEALRWVHNYVEYFGGDPNQITIAGESAGSASVTLLLLAPQTRGFNPIPFIVLDIHHFIFNCL